MTPSADKISITIHVPVRLDEIGYLGIVHHANYLKYMEHAHIKLLEQQGQDFLAWTKKGIRFVTVNETLNHRLPATYGDVLVITSWVEEIGNSSVKLGYHIANQATNKEILQATMVVVCIASDDKPTPVPHELRQALSRPE